MLYLVPGCLLSVIFISLAKGELNKVWEFNEEKFTNDIKPEEEEEKKKSKRKVTYVQKEASPEKTKKEKSQ